jgi:AcrR family transcriptional regulator
LAGGAGHLQGRSGGEVVMATLDEIVTAAAKVFRTKGYHAATVRDIADEVGILKGSLYHHFESKEALLYLVVKEPIAQMYRTLGEIVAADSSATDKLRRAIGAHLEAFDRHYPHLFVYLRERESVKRRFREKIGFSPRAYERLWQQILREGVASGEFRPDLDIAVTSYGVLGMLNWSYKWYDPQGRLRIGKVADEFTAFALAGLAAGPEKSRRTRSTAMPAIPGAHGDPAASRV